MALAVVLVVTATLLVRSLGNLSAVSPGFAVDHIVSARLSPPQFRFKDVAARRELYSAVLDRAAAIPGVTSVAVTDRLPFAGEAFGSVFVWATVFLAIAFIPALFLPRHKAEPTEEDDFDPDAAEAAPVLMHA